MINQTWVLTGDETVDAQLRAKHAYGSAPSMHLGKALLDLVGESKKAGEACLVVCDRLSSGLPDRPSDEKLHTINLIQQLLLYAKLQVPHVLSFGSFISLLITSRISSSGLSMLLAGSRYAIQFCHTLSYCRHAHLPARTRSDG